MVNNLHLDCTLLVLIVLLQNKSPLPFSPLSTSSIGSVDSERSAVLLLLLWSPGWVLVVFLESLVTPGKVLQFSNFSSFTNIVVFFYFQSYRIFLSHSNSHKSFYYSSINLYLPGQLLFPITSWKGMFLHSVVLSLCFLQLVFDW